MKKFTVTIDDCQIPVYLDDLTNCMQMRFGKTGDIHEFECGIDLISGYWLTNVGIYGSYLDIMVYNYLKFTKKCPDYIYISDDEEITQYYPGIPVSASDALSNDVDYTIVTHIEEE